VFQGFQTSWVPSLSTLLGPPIYGPQIMAFDFSYARDRVPRVSSRLGSSLSTLLGSPIYGSQNYVNAQQLMLKYPRCHWATPNRVKLGRNPSHAQVQTHQGQRARRQANNHRHCMAPPVHMDDMLGPGFYLIYHTCAFTQLSCVKPSKHEDTSYPY
jgi:hypothetical protein